MEARRKQEERKKAENKAKRNMEERKKAENKAKRNMEERKKAENKAKRNMEERKKAENKARLLKKRTMSNANLNLPNKKKIKLNDTNRKNVKLRLERMKRLKKPERRTFLNRLVRGENPMNVLTNAKKINFSRAGGFA